MVKNKKGLRIKIIVVVSLIFASVALQSCFTGVEGTSKITLSKRDRAAVASRAEDQLLNAVSIPVLQDWQPGKKFMVADEKFRLIADMGGGGTVSIGDVIFYNGASAVKGAGGGDRTKLSFLKEGAEIGYIIDRPLNEALVSVTMADIPMLIDLDIVGEVGSLLKGKTIWTRTALWYGENMEYKKGRKFVPVVVNNVSPGNAFFPLLIEFNEAGGGERGQLLMNIGNAGNESRNFGKLFLLEDPRNNYRHITDEHWSAIQRETLMQGMTKEECKLSKGNPSEVDSGHNYSNAMEIWSYPDGTTLRFVDGLLTWFN